MKKKIFVLLLVFKNIYAQNFFNILSKEDNLIENERMWVLFKKHFRKKFNINDKERKVFKKISEILEKNKKTKKNKRIPISDEDFKQYEKIKNKIDKFSAIKVLLEIVESSEFFNKDKDKYNPFDSELIKNILLHGFFSEDELFSKINISDSIVTEIAQALNFLKPEDIEKKTTKIKKLNDSYNFDKLNNLFNILRDNESIFVKLLNEKKANKIYGFMGKNRYIEIKDTITKSKVFLEKFGITIDYLTSIIGGILGLAFIPLCIKTGFLENGLLLLVSAVFLGVGIPITIYEQKILYNPSGFYDLLTEKYKTIKNYVEGMKSIYFEIKKNSNLYSLYKEKLTACENIFDNNVSLSKEQREMFKLLDLIPADWKYGKKNGKASAAKFCRFFLLFEKEKNIFKKTLLEIANIGADVNSVNLLRKKDLKNKWCIPTLINQNLPYLDVKKVWSAIVGQDSSVSNDICFGINEKNRKNSIMNHMILAGMNAGGKTTFLKSVCALLLLAQGIGICNASETTMTPYDKIFCMIDVSSDPGKNFSEFQNQLFLCDRLSQLNSLFKLSRKKLFLVTDELLMGTNPRDYNIFIHKFAEDITSNEYFHSINAVHMSTLVDYANTHPEKYMCNYTMNTKVLNNQKEKELEYTYKVKPGVVDEKIAQALAKQMYKNGILKTKVLV